MPGAATIVAQDISGDTLPRAATAGPAALPDRLAGRWPYSGSARPWPKSRAARRVRVRPARRLASVPRHARGPDNPRHHGSQHHPGGDECGLPHQHPRVHDRVVGPRRSRGPGAFDCRAGLDCRPVRPMELQHGHPDADVGDVPAGPSAPSRRSARPPADGPAARRRSRPRAAGTCRRRPRRPTTSRPWVRLASRRRSALG